MPIPLDHFTAARGNELIRIRDRATGQYEIVNRTTFRDPAGKRAASLPRDEVRAAERRENSLTKYALLEAIREMVGEVPAMQALQVVCRPGWTIDGASLSDREVGQLAETARRFHSNPTLAKNTVQLEHLINFRPDPMDFTDFERICRRIYARLPPENVRNISERDLYKPELCQYFRGIVMRRDNFVTESLVYAELYMAAEQAMSWLHMSRRARRD